MDKRKGKRYLPIPIFLVLPGNGVLISVIVDEGVVKLVISDVFRRIKVEAEEIGRAFEINYLLSSERRQARLGQTSCSALAGYLNTKARMSWRLMKVKR